MSTAHPASAPYHARQIPLPEIGLAGQERLAKARVAIIGAGGLGVPVLTYLAAAGVGRLYIWDYDTVHESNLNRQFLFSPHDVGQSKASLVQKRLQTLYPLVHCHAMAEKVSSQALSAQPIDIIVSCVDNFATRRMLNTYALDHGLWLIDGGVDGFYGYMQAVDGKSVQKKLSEDACLACGQRLCAEAQSPVAAIGAVCGVIASLQATVCLQLLLGITDDYKNILWQYDAKRCELEKILLQKNPLCTEHI